LALMSTHLSLKALRSGIVAVMLRDILDHDLTTNQWPWTRSLSLLRRVMSVFVFVFTPIVWFQTCWQCLHTWFFGKRVLVHLPAVIQAVFGLLFQGGYWGIVMPACITLVISWLLCRARIEVVIQQIESRANLDWDEACNLVDELDEQLCKFWRFTSAGGLWAGMLLNLMVMLLLGLSIQANHGMIAGVVIQQRGHPLVICAWNCSVAIGMLVSIGMLASLTSNCSSTLASRRSVLNASRRRFQVSSLLSDAELIRYRQYMQHLQSKQRGVELGGLVLVSQTGVVQLASQICVNVPVIITVLWVFARQSRPASE